ncbi:MAG: hypothetical protein JXR53_03675 [Bacteroidales bacterium]|nr:hypothetical protein [Bacteroidales bacterium]
MTNTIMRIGLSLLIAFISLQVYAQEPDFTVNCEVEFIKYTAFDDDPEYKDLPAINMILSVTNNGDEPIPDLCVSNRSKYVNLYINDTLNNPLSLYNGAEMNGAHLLQKGESDVYEFWVFERSAYADHFSVQWEYMGVKSEKIIINIPAHTIDSKSN